MLDATRIAEAAAEILNATDTVAAILRGEGDAPPLEHLLEETRLYAWSGICHRHHALDLLHELSVVVDLLEGDLVTPSGDGLVAQETRELVRRVMNAAHARYHIDEGESVTTEQLAALAGVTERTIRTATNPKNPNAIPITKDGHWTYIEGPHALKWLSQRKDFVATQRADNRPRAAVLSSSINVGDAWKMWRQAVGAEIGALAERLRWTAEQTRSYESVETGSPGAHWLELEPGFWRKLADHYESTEPAAVAALTYRKLAAAYADWRIAQEN